MKLRIINILITFLSFCVCGNAQITIKGVVRNVATKSPIADANVMLMPTSKLAAYAYTTTDNAGKFSLTTNVKADSILIMITGLNVRETTLKAVARTQDLMIDVVSEALKIREVKVKADPIKRRGDTINYLVGNFSDQNDRSIGDVLKKMPGIDVSSSGGITYNGRSINKFYIENMDMLEGRYGIAVNNVQAKDIATVQVLEDHQPKKILQGKQHSNDAAINLKLKDSAKGTFNTTAQLGLGYKPAMWNAEFVAMYFARKMQTLNTYKTNNSGDDVSREQSLQSYEDAEDDNYIYSIVKILTPVQPDVSRKRFLRNNIHSVSGNALFRISEDIDIKTNVNYVHDRQKSKSNSLTTYILPNGNIFIPENIYARQTSDQINADIQYLANTKTSYMKNQIQLGGAWNTNFGTVQTNSDNVTQNLKNPQFNIADNFSTIKIVGKYMINLMSRNAFTKSTTTLDVRPLLYNELFDSNSIYEGARQELKTDKFNSRTTIFTSRDFGVVDIDVSAGYNLNIEKLTSALSPFDANTTIFYSDDSLHNNIRWNEIKLFVSPGINIKPRGRFSASVGIPFSFLYQKSNDKIRAEKNSRNLFFIEPNAVLSYKININTSISAGASLAQNNGGIYDVYGGYIMNNYRTAGNNVGRLDKQMYQNYNLSLSYGNALTSVFGSASVMYYKSTSEIFRNVNYSGILSQSTSYERRNASDGYIASGKLSKRFDNISTTVGMFCTYRKSFSDLLRQENLIKYISDYLNAGVNVNTHFGKNIRFDYGVSFGRSTGKIRDGEKYDAIKNITQNAALAFFVSQSFTISVSGEHFYNSAVTNGSRSMFFADAYLTYKTKRVEYILEANNLTSQKYYKSATYSDVMSYVYNYELRPISMMFKVKFSLK